MSTLQDRIAVSAFVIKATDLAILNYLEPSHPRPLRLEWINRGTNQKLRPTSIDQLLRTLYGAPMSHSVQRLHDSAGLRVVLRTESERASFKDAFERARTRYQAEKGYLVTAMFDDREQAEKAVAELRRLDVPSKAISLLWMAGQYMERRGPGVSGHSKASVAAAVAGGGLAGAIFGVAVLMIPGVGPVVAAGALAASLASTMASVGAAVGATGGAIARMLTDFDVEGRAARFYEREVKRGKVFVSVDTRIAPGKTEVVHRLLSIMGGKSADEPFHLIDSLPTLSIRD
jgi:hypothetical protein